MHQLLLVSTIFLSPLVAGVHLNFHFTGNCTQQTYWCVRQDVYEVDTFKDDFFGSNKTCGVGFMHNNVKAEEQNDGRYDYTLELMSQVFHNCSSSGIVHRAIFYLTSFDGYKSNSNYESISTNIYPISPINYEGGNMWNFGSKAESEKL